MTAGTLLILMLLFQVKHLLADYVFQTRWMVANKGRYGHPGGVVHAGLHALLTAPVLLFADVRAGLLVAICLGEWLLHYHIDWTKDRLTRARGLTTQDKGYWTLAGLDQSAHQLTYLLFLWILIA